jgi:hypothetical protein
VPYTFAHPALAVPVAKLLGRRAVPSALVIGSMIPDAWYLLPLLDRGHTHGLLGALWFCLPAGLAAYAAFHLVFKQPMLALLPRRIACRAGAWAAPGLPASAWHWVLLSLGCGIASHLAWDAFTHGGHAGRLMQHASTLLGSAFLGGWVWRKLRAAPARADVPQAPRALRIAAVGAMVVLPLVAFLVARGAFDGLGWRTALRGGAVMAACTFGLVALSFCLLWRVSPRLRARPRPRARACATARPE